MNPPIEQNTHQTTFPGITLSKSIAFTVSIGVIFDNNSYF